MKKSNKPNNLQLFLPLQGLSVPPSLAVPPAFRRIWLYCSLFSVSIFGCGALMKANIPVNVPIKDNTIDVKPEAKLVGVDKSEKKEVKQTANRDAIEGGVGNSNDSKMIMSIFNTVFNNIGKIIAGLFSFILSLLLGVWGMLKYQAVMYDKLLSAKDVYIENLRKSNDIKDQKLDEWMMGRIDKSLNGKGGDAKL